MNHYSNLERQHREIVEIVSEMSGLIQKDIEDEAVEDRELYPLLSNNS